MRRRRRLIRVAAALLVVGGLGAGCLRVAPPKTPNQRAVERRERPVPAPSPPPESPPRPAPPRGPS